MQKTIYSDAYRALIRHLKAARLAQNLSQNDVANRLKTSRHFVSRIETFDTRLDVLHYVLLCRLEPA